MSEAVVLAIIAHAAPTLAAIAAVVVSMRGRSDTKAQLVDIHTLVNGERSALKRENEDLRKQLSERPR